MTLDRQVALDCLKRAFQLRKPEIINSDQGGQFTNDDYIKLLQIEGIKISMDGKGASSRQYFCGTVFPVIKVRRCLSERVCDSKSVEKGARSVHQIL
jgi:putative transposase